MIYDVTQLLTGFEVGNTLRRHFNARTRFRISTNPGLSLTSPEAAKPTNLDLLSFMEAIHYAVENGLYDRLGILSRHFHDFRHFLDQLGLRHDCLVLSSPGNLCLLIYAA